MQSRVKNLRAIGRKVDPKQLPKPLPMQRGERLVHVYVEGYEDVAFWRSIFDRFTSSVVRFEISVPTRSDLPKGKKVLLSMTPQSGSDMILCADADFDYLFCDHTEQSRLLNSAKYMFHTYAYATENFLCYAPSLHNVCVKATKVDTQIFDFERFMAEYSEVIYPALMWYIFSASRSSEYVFILSEFRATVRFSYFELENNGAATLDFVSRNVERKVLQLSEEHPELVDQVVEFTELLASRGVSTHNCYLFMHGHTLMDNVVMPMLEKVCEKLRQIALSRINESTKKGVALENEISNYSNTQRSIRDVLLDNVNYAECPLFDLVCRDIELFVKELE